MNIYFTLMEIRKVQVTGGASFIVSLPKAWAKKQGIKKNDKVGIIVKRDGSLIIMPKISKEYEKRRKEFDINGIENENYIFRLLLGAYIMGYNIIVVKSRERIKPSVRSATRYFTKTAIGLEIIEETKDTIVIKDFLNPSELPFEKAIRRIVSIIDSMHEDNILALRNKDEKLFSDVIARDDDIDRMHWLISRQYNILSKSFEDETANYSIMSKILERIGDHAVRIAKYSMKVLKTMDEEITEIIVETEKMATGIFKSSIQSFFDKSLEKANESIERIKELINACTKISNAALQQESATAIYLGYIEESIRRTGEYSGDLAEYVINRLIEEDTKP